MTGSLSRFVVFVLGFVLAVATPAHADATADRNAIADALGKLSTHSRELARIARSSDDRAVRKKFASRAAEIADDLEGLARRTRKDVSMQGLARDASKIADDARELVGLADDAEDKAERKKLRAHASVLEEGITLTRKAMEAVAAKKDAPAKPAPMSPDAFKRLVAAISDTSFDDEKVQVAVRAASSNWFLSSQVGAVMDLISFGDGKVDVAAAMWPRITDRENSYTIYNKLTFDSDKQKLRKRVGN